MDVISEMVETLHKSVADIVAASPEKRDELLATSFAEFEAALKPELEKAVVSHTEEVLGKIADEDAEAAAAEEPLYKGLGTVGRVASLMSSLARQVKDITDGDPDDPDADVASEDVADLLDHMVGVGELALRAAVNEHVDIAGPDEEVEDGLNYVHVPNAEDPSDEAALVVKTVLPEELAKFACDPAALTMAAVELGSGLLLDCGVPQETLAKMFDVAGDTSDVLAKDAGLAPADADAAPDPADFPAQLEILGRIMAAGLMQVDHLMQLTGDAGGAGSMDGAADPDLDPNADPDADPNAGADAGDGGDGDADPEGDADPGDVGAGTANGDGEDPKKKKPFAKAADGALAEGERAELEKLRGQVGSLGQQLQKMSSVTPEIEALRKQVQQLSRQPAPAKALLQTTALSKAADTGGGEGEDPLAKLAAEFDAARGEDARNQVLLKATIKYPGLDLSALRKHV